MNGARRRVGIVRQLLAELFTFALERLAPGRNARDRVGGALLDRVQLFLGLARLETRLVRAALLLECEAGQLLGRLALVLIEERLETVLIGL